MGISASIDNVQSLTSEAPPAIVKKAMRQARYEREKQLRKGTRSIVFGLAVLIGLAVYKIAERIPELQDFEILLGLVIGATVFAILRRFLL